MADELIIGSQFDSEPILEGMEKVASSVTQGAAQMEASFANLDAISSASIEGIGAFGATAAQLVGEVTPSAESLKAVGAGIDNLLTSLGAAGDEITNVGQEIGLTAAPSQAVAQANTALQQSINEVIPSEVAFSEALEKTFSSLAPTATALEGVLVPAETAFKTALDNLFGPLTNAKTLTEELTQAEAALASQLDKTFEVLNSASTVFTSTASSEATFSASLDKLLEQFTEVEGKSEAVAEGISVLGSAIGAIATDSEIANEAIDEFKANIGTASVEIDALAGSISSIDATESQLSGLATASNEVEEAAQRMYSSFQVAAAGAQQLLTPIVGLVSGFDELQAVLDDLATALTTTGSSEEVLSEAAVQATEAIAAQTEVLSETDSALYEFAEALNAEAEANAEATAAAEEHAHQWQGSGLASMQAAQIAASELTASLKTLSVSLEEGLVPTKALADAMTFLNSEAAILGATADEVAAQQEVVRAQAQKLGLQVIQTAEGMVLLAKEEDGATRSTISLGNSAVGASTKISSLNSTLGYLGGRAAAYELGVSQLGFAFGILGRTVAPLNQLLIAAFPIIAPVLLTQIVIDLADKFIHLEDEIRKTSKELDDVAISADKAANSLEIQNLKLEDQIAKFEGRPNTNRLAEAGIEAKIKIDDLTKSLIDANQKAQDLIEKSNVGLFTFLFTGIAPTSAVGDLKSIYKDIEAKQVAYDEALSKQRQYNLETEVDQSKANETLKSQLEEQVTVTRDALRKSAEARLQEVEDAKRIDNERIKNKTDYAFEPHSSAEVDRAYGKQERALNNIISLSKAQEAQTKATAKAISDEALEAEAANAAEARSRERTTEEPDIKNTEKIALAEVEAKRQQAENIYKLDLEKVKSEVDIAVLGGEKRAQAELESEPKILTARQNLTTALLSIQKEQYDAQKEAIEQQQKLDQKTLVGPELVAARKNTASELERVEIENKSAIAAIKQQEATEDIHVEQNSAKQRQEIRLEAERQLIFDAREGAKERIDVARNEEQEKSAEIKSGIQHELSIVQENESLRYITARDARDKRISLLGEEQQKLDDVLNAQKAALQQQQQYVQSLITPETSSAGVKELTREYDQLGKAINDATSAQNKLATAINSQKIDAGAKFVDELAKKYQQAFNNIADTTAASFTRMLRGEETFTQLASKLFAQLEQSIIQGLFRIVARHAAAEAEKLALSNKGILGSLARIIVGEHAKLTATAQTSGQQTATVTAAQTAQTTAVLAAQTAQTAAVQGASAAQAGAKAGELAALISANVAAAESDVATAAATVFVQAIQSIPFPANIVAAPALAAETYSLGSPYIALAAAEGGWDLPMGGPFPTMLHSKEMVLNQPLAEGFRNIIAKQNRFSIQNDTQNDSSKNEASDLHYHDHRSVNALDGSNASDYLDSHQQVFTKHLEKLVRAGRVNPKTFGF